MATSPIVSTLLGSMKLINVTIQLLLPWLSIAQCRKEILAERSAYQYCRAFKTTSCVNEHQNFTSEAIGKNKSVVDSGLAVPEFDRERADILCIFSCLLPLWRTQAFLKKTGDPDQT